MSYPDPGTTPTPVDPGVAAHAAVQHSTATTLPFTGGDVAGLGLIGAVCVAAGVAIVRRSRRARVA